MKYLFLLVVSVHLSGCLMYRTDNCELSFVQPAYMDRARAVTLQEIRVLSVALEILNTESSWNKKGDRLCFYNAKWSLFCALAQASVEVSGEYKHRRVAIQETRFTINDHFPERWNNHQLLEFNNNSATGFNDIKWVLEETRRRLILRYQADGRV